MNDRKMPRVAIVDDPPPPLNEEGLAVGLCVSVGVAQFISEVEMTEHPSFDKTNADHLAILEEFIGLRQDIVEAVEPIILMKMLGEVLGDILEDDNAEEESSPSQGAAS